LRAAQSAANPMGVRQIEPGPQAEDAWMCDVGEVARATLRYSCGSWYLSANIGKPRAFL